MSVRLKTAVGELEFDTAEEAYAFHQRLSSTVPLNQTPQQPPHIPAVPLVPPPVVAPPVIGTAGSSSGTRFVSLANSLSEHQWTFFDALQTHGGEMFADDLAAHLRLSVGQVGPSMRHILAAIDRIGLERRTIIVSEKRKKPGQPRVQAFIRLMPSSRDLLAARKKPVG